VSRAIRTLIGITAIALVVTYLFSHERRAAEKPLLRTEPPKSAPRDSSLDFSARGLTGGKISLKQYRGHPVIVDFWATWCAPCRRQIPELIDLYNRYHKTRGLVVLGVSCDLIQGEGIRAVEPFVDEFQINYPIALADQALVDSLGVEAIPTTLFIGPNGRIVSKIVGAGRRGEISESTRMLLEAGKGDASPIEPSEGGGHVVDIRLPVDSSSRRALR
jgi:thiol-disulfide isomerase/thioredoxin